jgi:hypothetical protein
VSNPTRPLESFLDEEIYDLILDGVILATAIYLSHTKLRAQVVSLCLHQLAVSGTDRLQIRSTAADEMQIRLNSVSEGRGTVLYHLNYVIHSELEDNDKLCVVAMIYTFQARNQEQALAFQPRAILGVT